MVVTSKPYRGYTYYRGNHMLCVEKTDTYIREIHTFCPCTPNDHEKGAYEVFIPYQPSLSVFKLIGRTYGQGTPVEWKNERYEKYPINCYVRFSR